MPQDIKETELTITLTIKEEKNHLTTAKSSVIMSSDSKEEQTVFAFSMKIDDLAEPGKYSVSASFTPQTLPRDIYNASGTVDIEPYQLSIKGTPEIYQTRKGETRIRLYIIWSENTDENSEPVVYILPEDEIGAYYLKDDGNQRISDIPNL